MVPLRRRRGIILTKSTSFASDEWNEEIHGFFDGHEEVRSLTEREARTEYLRELEGLPMYGSTVYHVTRDFDTAPEDVLLAVTQRGIELYKPDASEPFYAYELRDLLRWGYVPKSTFYISVGEFLNPLVASKKYIKHTYAVLENQYAVTFSINICAMLVFTGEE